LLSLGLLEVVWVIRLDVLVAAGSLMALATAVLRLAEILLKLSPSNRETGVAENHAAIRVLENRKVFQG